MKVNNCIIGKRHEDWAQMHSLWCYVPLCLVFMPLLMSCSVIDEDRDDCVEHAKMYYELRLVTNITTEITTQLTTQTDIKLGNALHDYLDDIFTDYAHDVDLSFYDTMGDSIRLQHDEHFMDANQASYTLNLPMRQYMHLATANILDNDLVTLAYDEKCHPSMLRQVDRDTIDSHTTGLFTARQSIEVLEGVDQNFNVSLFMANCAAALVIDPRGHDTDGIKVYATGFATGFQICDSAYVFPEKSPIVRTTMITPEDGGDELGFCCVTFPSREAQENETRSVIETEEPFISETSDESLWEFRVYVPRPSSQGTRTGESITESILHIKKSQRAGQMTIVKVYMGDDGEMKSSDQEVGVSVTLDWTPGGIYHPEF